jgi:hypothetical protein
MSWTWRRETRIDISLEGALNWRGPIALSGWLMQLDGKYTEHGDGRCDADGDVARKSICARFNGYLPHETVDTHLASTELADVTASCFLKSSIRSVRRMQLRSILSKRPLSMSTRSTTFRILIRP